MAQRRRLEVGDSVDVADHGNDVCGVSDELHRRRPIEHQLSSAAVNDRLEASVAFDNDQSAGVRKGRRALAHLIPLTLRQCVQLAVRSPLDVDEHARPAGDLGGVRSSTQGEDFAVFRFVRDRAELGDEDAVFGHFQPCLLYTSPSPRDGLLSRMPSSA